MGGMAGRLTMDAVKLMAMPDDSRTRLKGSPNGAKHAAWSEPLPLDEIKIDQSFVRDVLSDPNDASIAHSILALGQSLNLDVVAEGVETEAQHVFLADRGCQTYQGYLFNRPQPPAVFEAWAHTQRVRTTLSTEVPRL